MVNGMRGDVGYVPKKRQLLDLAPCLLETITAAELPRTVTATVCMAFRAFPRTVHRDRRQVIA
jgi:hypothetical protein